MTDDLWALRQLAAARRLQDWMFSLLRPSRPGPMLEVGAGIGTFSRRLLDAGADRLVLLEPEAPMADELERVFAGDDRVEVVREALPASPSLAARGSSFRYALLQNVLEHIDDDTAALASVVEALEPGGELAVLVPAHPRLYGRLDRDFGHRRRYTRDGLQTLVADSGARLDDLRSFNLLGVPGWLLAGRSRSIGLTAGPLRVFEAVVPFWRPVEAVLRPRVGLSLVARACKPW